MEFCPFFYSCFFFFSPSRLPNAKYSLLYIYIYLTNLVGHFDILNTFILLVAITSLYNITFSLYFTHESWISFWRKITKPTLWKSIFSNHITSHYARNMLLLALPPATFLWKDELDTNNSSFKPWNIKGIWAVELRQRNNHNDNFPRLPWQQLWHFQAQSQVSA